jgi:cellobiose phosphorylase
MGNSFLPYHDYGRGGRGWRDLWQDLLAILFTEQTEIDQDLLNNFAGIRMDGSNATIIGAQPGEFRADRNSIPRVWMDHGAWPLITTKHYLDQTGDIEFLLRDQCYFKDHLSHRCQQQDPDWDPEAGTKLTSINGELIQGSILEHLLVQHLTVFFNVGEHNLIKLEGGDWNDGLDMAEEKGESVAFSAMYAGNLRVLSGLCKSLIQSGIKEASIAVELLPLLDQISGAVDYESVQAKQRNLQKYFDTVQGELSGKKISLPLDEIASDLKSKADWLSSLIRGQEWLIDGEGRGWFNGYYDNQGERVEGKTPQGYRMTLTGQVFPLMAGIPTEKQTKQILKAADHYLYDPSLRSYRLNTNFGSDLPELGRAFRFAYGHKENGAAFCHMSVMFAYALYRRGLVEEGWQILDGLFSQSQDFAKSCMYPGIPEYFNPRGRGVYPYLTGSAAWYIFTLLTESFGVKGQMGDLKIYPKLTAGQFSGSDQLSVRTFFAGKRLEVVYHNPEGLAFGEYRIGDVFVNGSPWDSSLTTHSVVFKREDVIGWPEHNKILVALVAL